MNDAFPSKYLKESDLKGREVTVTIRSVEMEDVGTDSSPEEKPVLHFNGKEKGLVLNRTNAGAIAAEYGDEMDDWAGKKVIIYPTTTPFKGKTVPCLRIRVPSNGPTDGEEPPF
jgi:hypothetical protein